MLKVFLGFYLILSVFNFIFFKLIFLDFITLIAYFLLLDGLSFSFFIMIKRFFSFSGVLTYSIARVLSLPLFSLAIWWMAYLFPFSLSWVNYIFFLILMIGSLFIYYKNNSLLVFENRFPLKLEITFKVSLIFILILVSFHPEIFWGEKPMDINMLGYFSKMPTLLISDPWAFGQTMHYYYFGYFSYANLLRMSRIPLDVGFWTSLATSGALLIISLCTLSFFFLKNMTDKLKESQVLSLIIGIGVFFTGNLASLLNLKTLFLAKNYQSIFSYFWSTTRIFKHGFFSEFPLWTWLFGDLHPHVMAWSWTVLAIYLIVDFFSNLKLDKNKWLFLILVFSILLISNAWDFILATACFFIILLFNILRDRNFKKLVLFLTPLVSVLLILPFFLLLKTGRPVFLGIAYNSYSNIFSYIKMDGLWFFLLFFFCLYSCGNIIKIRSTKLFNILPVIMIFILSLVLSFITHRDELIVYGVFAVIVLILIDLTMRFKMKRFNEFYLFTLMVFSLWIITDSIVFMDRMNTLFKFNNHVYVFMGLISSLLISFLWIKKKSKLITFVACLIGLTGFIGHVFLVKSSTRLFNYNYKRNGIYGSQFLSVKARGIEYVLNYLNSSLAEFGTILEFPGKSFDHTKSLVSAYSGFPSYLGWIGHVKIRGVSIFETSKRQRQINYWYASEDALSVYQELKKAKIKYIVIDPFVRKRFRAGSLAKFDLYSTLFQKIDIYKNEIEQRYQLYRVL